MPLTLDNVGHAFPGGPVLFSGLHARLEPGRVYALTGPSGSGKSTLLGILAGWITASQGEVRREGVDRQQWVFQNPHGVAGRTALDHVTLPYLARGLARTESEEQAQQLLDEMGLSGIAGQPFRTLSGGEAQRLMLARALASQPDLLLVDEPTAQLDHRTASEVVAALARLATHDVIVVVATHDPRVRAAGTDVIDLSVAS